MRLMPIRRLKRTALPDVVKPLITHSTIRNPNCNNNMPNNYHTLSPSNFETLAADILSAVHGVYFERFGEGRDGGIDARHVTADGKVWIGQAKRYKDTAALLRAMPSEQQKMQALLAPPSASFGDRFLNAKARNHKRFFTCVRWQAITPMRANLSALLMFFTHKCRGVWHH